MMVGALLHRWRSLLWLLLIPIVVGAALRLSIGSSDYLWLDELHTAWSTGGEFSLVGSRAVIGNQGPLYFWLVWLVRQSDLESLAGVQLHLSLRLVSVVSGWALILLSSYLVWTWTHSKLATIAAAWLIAVDSSLIFYATEARPYALMQFFGVLQVWQFWIWLQRFHRHYPIEMPAGASQGTLQVRQDHEIKSWRWADLSLAVFTGAMLAMHLTSFWLPVFEVAFFAAYSFYRLSKRTTRSVFHLQAAFQSATFIGLITMAILLPIISMGTPVFENRENWAPISQRQQLISEFNLVLRWGMLMPLLGIAFFSLASGKRFRAGSNDSFEIDNAGDSIRVKTVFVGGWALSPIAAAWLLDYFGIAPVANSRYVQINAVAIPLFSALCLAWLQSIWQKVTLFIVVMISSLILNPWLTPLVTTGTLPRFRWEDWQSPILEINRDQSRETVPIFLFANLLEDRAALINTEAAFQDYLTFPLKGEPRVAVRGRTLLPYPTLDRQAIRSADLEMAWEQRSFWLIIRGDDQLAQEIVSDVRKQFDQFSHDRDQKVTAGTIQRAEFKQSPWSDIKLFLFER